MKDLPHFLVSALDKFHEGEPKYLIQIFKNGVQLCEFKETSDLIENLLLGKPTKRAGRPKKKKGYEENSVIALIAQLKGAGFAVYSDTYSGKKTACEIVAESYDLKPGTVYKNIWCPAKDSDFALQNIRLGEENSEQYQLLYS